MSSTSDSIADRYPIKRGVTLGATAFVGVLLVGFLLGGLTVSGAVVVSYLMHLWPFLQGGTGGGAAFVLILSLVPIVVLLASGYQLTREADQGGSAFGTGATVTAGYAPLALVALGYLFNGAQIGSLGMAAGTFVIKQNAAVAFLFTGILVPAVFGGLGGVIAGSRSE